ncbi:MULTISPECIES: beta-ketoacyl synthase [Nocardia]|uniref:beta-ketoacyl synthase n=1 Tax=Nocardia TaxID=1817 RepID=UPI000D695F42|nr:MULTISPECIES: beta-ketoacyl synthase [Nocardia]
MTVLDFDGIPFDPVPAPAAHAPAAPAGANAGAQSARGGPEAGPRTDTEYRPVTATGGASVYSVGRRIGEEHNPSATGAGGVVHNAIGRLDGDLVRGAVSGTAGDVVRSAVGELRAGVVEAHRTALAAQVALQRAIWQRSASSSAPGARPFAPRAAETYPPFGIAAAGAIGAERAGAPGTPAAEAFGTDAAPPADVLGRRLATLGTHEVAPPLSPSRAASHPGTSSAPEDAFKPPARSAVTHLDLPALRQLATADIAGVFGPGYRRGAAEVTARLAATSPLVLTGVERIELRGGNGKGLVVATFDGDPRAAVVQAAEVFALYTGMWLCLSHGDLVSAVGMDVEGENISGKVELVVTRIDLVPRPHVTGSARVSGVADPVEVTVAVVEPAGASVGPGAAATGLLLNEFHMTHLSRGDQAIAMGPEFAEYTGVRATRLPTGGLLLVDRVIEFDGERGRLDSASYTTEYDSPADSWYYADTANDSMPHFVYMETSLQAALLMGYYAGPTLTQAGTTLSLRNLGGTATVLRQVDLRDATIEQSSRLLSTTILPGSSLQTFDYTLSVDGEPFYRGETMFGYFSDQALANQTGLDAGRTKPAWLSENPSAAVRSVDVAARRADPSAPLCARRNLTLIDRVDVVDGGGEFGEGYLHSLRVIDPSDWYFARHFHLDPVIPGSLGVESVIHAIQEWMLDAGHADTMTDPVFRIPRDIAFSWRYRGQFLPTDGTVELEAHIKSVTRTHDGVVVVADGSLWKPGLRIYELLDLAVELTDRKVT